MVLSSADFSKFNSFKKFFQEHYQSVKWSSSKLFSKVICTLTNFSCRLLTFFKIYFFEKFFQEHYQRVKPFGFRSGPTFCRTWSGSKLFDKIISRWQKLPLAKKELKSIITIKSARKSVHTKVTTLKIFIVCCHCLCVCFFLCFCLFACST